MSYIDPTPPGTPQPEIAPGGPPQPEIEPDKAPEEMPPPAPDVGGDNDSRPIDGDVTKP